MVQDSKEASQILVSMLAVEAELAELGIGKDRQNEQQRFMFRGIDDVLNALSGLFAKHRILVFPKTLARVVTDRVSKKGDPLYDVAVHMEYHFKSAIDGSVEIADMWGEAMDQGDKATGKAKSMAYKELMFQVFCIPIEGNPENRDADYTSHETGRKPAPRAEPENPPAEKPRESDGPETIKQALKRLVKNDANRDKLAKKLEAAYGVALLDQLPAEKHAEAIIKAEKFVAEQAARRK